jgi:Zn-dependent M28 family amino/carboxypeptidase
MRTALCVFFLLVTLLHGVPASAPPVAPPRSGPRQSADQVDSAARVITPTLLLDHVKALAADDKEGRAPGTVGEERTVAYLAAQFKRLGLAPGNPDGTFVQAVPLIGFKGQATAGFEVKGAPMPLAVPDDIVVVSRQGLPDVQVSKAPIVFVGYGVVAPEFEWDDFKGVDVRGKTIVVLAGDPPVPDPANPAGLDSKVFKGAALTYYGRWTYKYEMAAKRGAAAAIIVHETGPAGYAFDVVKASWGRENFGVAGPDEAARHAPVDAWVTLDRAKALFSACGLDFEALKARAATRGFKPVLLGAAASFAVRNDIRTISSRNVIGRLEGRDPVLKHEYVMYSAHWDGFGINRSLPGDQILNGALDNGSGVATMLAMAEALAKLEGGTKRSVLFLSPTAEESTMLGAKYYAEHPLWPLEKTLADINMDIMNFWGRTKAIVSIGYGMTTLEDLLLAEAAKQGRLVLPDPEAEKGYFYRSDHFELAKQGVPAVHFLHPGADYRDRPADYGQRMRDRYTAEDYHKVSDEVKADWDLSGAVEDAQLLFRLGLAVAQGDTYPEWKPGTEFRSVRAARLKRK